MLRLPQFVLHTVIAIEFIIIRDGTEEMLIFIVMMRRIWIEKS